MDTNSNYFMKIFLMFLSFCVSNNATPVLSRISTNSKISSVKKVWNTSNSGMKSIIIQKDYVGVTPNYKPYTISYKMERLGIRNNEIEKDNSTSSSAWIPLSSSRSATTTSDRKKSNDDTVLIVVGCIIGGVVAIYILYLLLLLTVVIWTYILRRFNSYKYIQIIE